MSIKEQLLDGRLDEFQAYLEFKEKETIADTLMIVGTIGMIAKLVWD